MKKRDRRFIPSHQLPRTISDFCFKCHRRLTDPQKSQICDECLTDMERAREQRRKIVVKIVCHLDDDIATVVYEGG